MIMALHYVCDHGNCRMRRDVFEHSCAELGVKPLVDMFASADNAQCCKWWSQGDQNAFRHNWSGIDGWCNPPWHLLGAVLRKIVTDKAQVTLVVPE